MNNNERYLTYPNYFMVRATSMPAGNNNTSFHNAEGDKEVNELYDEVFDNDSKISQSELIRRVVRKMNELIPNLPSFVRLNRVNQHISDYQYEYLYDLHEYVIRGGKKPNTPALLTYMKFDRDLKQSLYPIDHRKNIISTAAIPKDKKINSLLRSNTTSTWIERSGDIKEIICTLYVLFGKSF